jgi:hypothetical protein
VKKLTLRDVIGFGTGTAVAFGLSTCAVVVGALLAVVLEWVEVLPDDWWPIGWVLLAAFGTIGAGFTVRDVAGPMTPWSIAVAGIITFGAVVQISETIESTGTGEPQIAIPVLSAVAFVALLSLGAWLAGRSGRLRLEGAQVEQPA